MAKPTGIISTFHKQMINRILYILLVLFIFSGCAQNSLPDAVEVSDKPPVFPFDFGATLPLNIAPVNYLVKTKCDEGFVILKSKNSILQNHLSGNQIVFQPTEWSNFLASSANDSIFVQFYLKSDKKWLKYRTESYFVSEDAIDPYLVYRLIKPGYQTWSRMGIYQRNLTDFDVSTILDNQIMPHSCMNCHSMAGNNPDNMLLHIRYNHSGTILMQHRKVQKLETKTATTFSSVSFPYWHPSANYIAFSINKVRQIFPSHGTARAHAFDQESDMVIYDVRKNEFFTSPLIFSKDAFEAFPCFSADGKTLYFVTTPASDMPHNIKNQKYSLCSISFDVENGELGNKVDTLISAAAIGKSFTMPRVSPDGKRIMLTRSDFGNFPAYNEEADLYMYQTADSSLVAIDEWNSNAVESYHSWSSNGRWVVFSSRRIDGLYMNAYFAHIDESGKPSKPFLLPQEEPAFYQNALYSFNIPEFAIKRVYVNPYDIEKVAKSTKGEQVRFDYSH